MNNLQEYIKEKAKPDKNYSILKLFKVLLAIMSILTMISCFIIKTDNVLVNIFYFILVLFSSMMFYLFALLVEVVLEVNKKITKWYECLYANNQISKRRDNKARLYESKIFKIVF